MHCVTDERLASYHDPKGTTGVMVTRFQGYTLP
jgi:hypothetical protein